MSSPKRYLITSALPYVNNVPHLGNLIGSTLSADFFARYCRLRGRETLYVCGSDCYGTASEVKAKQAGVTPEELCDKYHLVHKNVYDWFDISFDVYGQTSTDTHTEITRQITTDLDNNKKLSTQTVTQLYCQKCDMFLADRYVNGNCPHCGKMARGDQCDASECGKILHAINLQNPRCAVCNSEPESRDSEHVYLNLNDCQEQLESWFNDTQDVWTNNSVAITRSWLKSGLEPRCITRDLKWGTPVGTVLNREWPDKVFYVWYDAPIGYISITACARDDWRKWWIGNSTELYQFMAKDNIPFHTVMFPALLQATGKDWTLVSRICATEYLNYEGQKFSKTAGVGIFGDQIQKLGIPADYWRYYLASIRPERSDSNFDRSSFQYAINELADKYGNLVHRLLNLIHKYKEGKPVVPTDLQVEESELLTTVSSLYTEYLVHFDKSCMVAALQSAIKVTQEVNGYLYKREPWKHKDTPKLRDAICSVALQVTFLASCMLSPFIPQTHHKLCTFLGLSGQQARDNTRLTEEPHLLDLSQVHITTFSPLIDKNIMKDFVD